MNNTLLTLPQYIRERLVSSLQSGLLTPPYSAASIGSVLGNSEVSMDVLGALNELTQMGISGKGTAAFIQLIIQATTPFQKPDLVWSGPEVAGLYARDTRRVYEELLGSAERSIWVSTYAFFDGPKAFEVLARNMDARPKLTTTLLLNIQRKHGDKRPDEHLVRAFAENFWKRDWPGAIRPRVFYDPRALEAKGAGGVLHAKAAVTDDQNVYITSANLTEAAFDRNIELGIIHRDRALATSIVSYLHSLIDKGILVPLPSA